MHGYLLSVRNYHGKDINERADLTVFLNAPPCYVDKLYYFALSGIISK